MKIYLTNLITEALKKLNYPERSFSIEYAKEKNFGDYSCNVPLILSKSLKKNPKLIAQEIVDNLEINSDTISKFEIAGAGFINIFLTNKYYKNESKRIIRENNSFGKSNINIDKTANLEWVSANPTGLLHAGHGRQICLGKAIANLLEWTGYTVTREYYYNDAGNQMLKLAESVRARYIQNTSDPDYPMPENAYIAESINQIANSIKEKYKPEQVKLDDLEFFKRAGEDYHFKRIKESLQRLGIKHDIFFSENSLYESGEIKKLLSELEKRNLIYDKDGAKWLLIPESEEITGDRVIIKSSGEYTYRLPDMAYHINKIKRGFDLIIDIFGSDHKDTYREVLYGVKSAGYDISNIKVIIHQMVTFKEGERTVKMSKRSDNVYYLEDLLDDVGVDATQFFFIMRNANSHLVFDIALAKEQSDKNPVYYLQYAHARICGILRNFKEINPSFSIAGCENNELDLLNSEDEIDLLKILTRFPDEVLSTAISFEPHKLITYLNNVAENFHKFYHNHRVINAKSEELSIQRIILCEITKQVLKNGFIIIGISYPERM